MARGAHHRRSQFHLKDDLIFYALTVNTAHNKLKTTKTVKSKAFIPPFQVNFFDVKGII